MICKLQGKCETSLELESPQCLMQSGCFRPQETSAQNLPETVQFYCLPIHSVEWYTLRHVLRRGLCMVQRNTAAANVAGVLIWKIMSYLHCCLQVVHMGCAFLRFTPKSRRVSEQAAEQLSIEATEQRSN